MMKSTIPFTLGIRTYGKGANGHSGGAKTAENEITDPGHIANCRSQVAKMCGEVVEVLDRLMSLRGDVEELVSPLDYPEGAKRAVRVLAGNVPEIGRAKSILESFCAEARSDASSEGFRRSRYFAFSPNDNETIYFVSNLASYRSVGEWLNGKRLTLGGKEYCLAIVSVSSPENIRLTRGKLPEPVLVRR